MSETDKAPATPPERPQAVASTPAVQPVPATPPATQTVSVPSPPTPAAAIAPLPVVVPRVPPPQQKRCLDCGAGLEGKYCIACGQRAQLRSLSLPALAHDAIHDLAHFDSRGWLTLRALLFRPGFLTSEFVQGRRTRYLPPFRLYLVLSLVFFVVLSCKPSEAPQVIGRNAAGQPSAVVTGSDPEALSEAMKDLSRELGTAAASDPEAQAAAKAAIAASQAVADPDSGLFEGADCKDMNWDGPGQAWFEPRLRGLCENTKGVSKRQFGRELLRNVPKMMFLFLPLLALVNLVLYVFRRRKYVEHLLFYVHFHAFAFLLLTLQVLLSMALGWAGMPFLGGLVTFAAIVYLFVALFKAMRTVYGQSRLMTSLKYLVVLMAYGVFSLLTLLGTMLYTAMTV